jgi:hypothetical protein
MKKFTIFFSFQFFFVFLNTFFSGAFANENCLESNKLNQLLNPEWSLENGSCVKNREQRNQTIDLDEVNSILNLPSKIALGPDQSARGRCSPSEILNKSDNDIQSFLKTFKLTNKNALTEKMEELLKGDLGTELEKAKLEHDQRRGFIQQKIDAAKAEGKIIAQDAINSFNESLPSVKSVIDSLKNNFLSSDNDLELMKLLPPNSTKLDLARAGMSLVQIGGGAVQIAADVGSLGTAGVVVGLGTSAATKLGNAAIDNSMTKTIEGSRILGGENNHALNAAHIAKLGKDALSALGEDISEQTGNVIPFVGGICQVSKGMHSLFKIAVYGSERQHETLLAWEKIYFELLLDNLKEKEKELQSILKSQNLENKIEKVQCLCQAKLWLDDFEKTINERFQDRFSYLNRVIERKKWIREKMKMMGSNQEKQSIKNQLRSEWQNEVEKTNGVLAYADIFFVDQGKLVNPDKKEKLEYAMKAALNPERNSGCEGQGVLAKITGSYEKDKTVDCINAKIKQEILLRDQIREMVGLSPEIEGVAEKPSPKHIEDVSIQNKKFEIKYDPHQDPDL